MENHHSSNSGQATQPYMWVDEFGDFFFRYAVSRLRDVNSAEDVVQQTFLAGLKHVDQYSGKGSMQGWLLGILKRKIIDFVRERRRTIQQADDEADNPFDRMFDRKGRWTKESASIIRQPMDSLEREEFWPIFRQCLAGLPPRQADVFALREMDDLSTEVICKELSISPSNLWVLLHRARLRLAICIKTRWHQENF